jgi:hypothetical protein
MFKNSSGDYIYVVSLKIETLVLSPVVNITHVQDVFPGVVAK